MLKDLNAEQPSPFAQYNNIKQQTNITKFKIRFHIVHSTSDYRFVIDLKFSNPAGL